MLGGAIALLHLIDFDEPFGFSLVEAMARGTPVVARRRGSMAEIIRAGENGFLVETTAEAVAAVRKSMALDRKAVRASAEARFGVERMVDEYVGVLTAGSCELQLGGVGAHRGTPSGAACSDSPTLAPSPTSSVSVSRA